MRARGAEPAVLWVFASIACQDDEWETPTAARTHTKGSLYSAPRRAVKAGRNPDDQDGDDVGHVRPVPRLAGAGTPRREGTIRAGGPKLPCPTAPGRAPSRGERAGNPRREGTPSRREGAPRRWEKAPAILGERARSAREGPNYRAPPRQVVPPRGERRRRPSPGEGAPSPGEGAPALTAPGPRRRLPRGAHRSRPPHHRHRPG